MDELGMIVFEIMFVIGVFVLLGFALFCLRLNRSDEEKGEKK